MSTINAESASYAHVNAAVASATYGDTVVVPAGSQTWASTLTITKGISLIGNGIGSTNITSNMAEAIIYDPDATTRTNQDLFRISGFTFLGAPDIFILLVDTSSTTVPTENNRIDHNRFVNTAGYPIYVSGNFWGCVDNNEFAGAQFFMVLGNEGDSWDTFYPGTFSFGTADNLYFEDNVFEEPTEVVSPDYFGVQSGQGGRWAFRHNTIDNETVGTPAFDQHGNQEGGICALMVCEIYENEFTSVGQFNKLEYQRGGKLLFYNNVADGSYPGLPDIISSDDVEDVDPINQPMHPQDTYFWNNMCNGTRQDCMQGDTQDYGGDIGVVPTENSHYWNQDPAFDGSAGVGVGTLAARPGSGLTVGVGYWATDTNTLYRATGASTWETYYTPYTYPHPLRNESHLVLLLGRA